MTTLNNVIETVKIGKYSFQLYKRENTASFSGCPVAVMFEKETPKGKYSKTAIIEHFVFQSIEKAEEYIAKKYRNLFLNLKAEKQRSEEKKESMKTLKASDFYAEGDIVYNSWGYEQTNVEFYQVVRVTAKSIEVREISQEMVENSMYSHGMAWDVVAVKDSFIEGGASYTLRVKPNGFLSSPKSFFYFKKWDGSKKYVSSYY